MAKTTYKQTTKGNIKGAKDLAKAAEVLQKIANSNKTKLSNVKKQFDQSKLDIAAESRRSAGLILEGHAAAGENYGQLGRDNDAAESDNSFSNLANQRRERAQTLDQVRLQGGGETDLLKMQGMALRNWSANQMDTNRSYTDTLTSINNSISDANIQTRTSLSNAASETDMAQRQNYNEWLQGQGSVMSEQTDIYGQIANLYGEGSSVARTDTAKTVTTGKKNQKTTQSQGTKETKLSKSYTKKQDAANKALVNTAKDLAKLNAETYKTDIQTPEDLGYTALQKREGVQNMDDMSNAQTLTKKTGPEGATLRTW